MQTTKSFIITNVTLDQSSYSINDYITLTKTRDNDVLITCNSIGEVLSEEDYQSNGAIFFDALRLGCPKINIRVAPTSFTTDQILYDILRNRNTFLFKFSSSISDDIETYEGTSIITETEIINIRKFHELYIEHSKKQKLQRTEAKWNETRWNYALNQYLSACSSITVDQSIQTLVTGLESLLVKGDGNIQYKVTLNAALILGSTYEERTEIIKKIKKMYNLRSKATHGEITELVRLLKKPDLYNDYFELKSIISKLLLITANMPEPELFERLDKVLLGGPSFLE
ncbi:MULTISPECIES: HEPN domain-containing protein [unclassified Paenibacillus]|jgi:hypothetical protein|uniref:HEPN domain-containing protein n=1 Tax=unclassified Paenibacillus TaxID=185978 RepID=UPI00042A1952|nr:MULTISPECIES: HEPN domain-containing protein [unclassified Paenibacillus]KGP81533.1 hypothetical protein P363_0127850 [Paenibacillus sp. MAEPY1]KGP84257.1 hypothetical protein P364_0104965 [Paenibacillus sp. MAEPY2]